MAGHLFHLASLLRSARNNEGGEMLFGLAQEPHPCGQCKGQGQNPTPNMKEPPGRCWRPGGSPRVRLGGGLAVVDGQLAPLQLPAHVTPDGFEGIEVPFADERDGRSRPAHAGGAPDAMDVLLHVLGRIVVDDL